jgi:putative transposase
MSRLRRSVVSDRFFFVTCPSVARPGHPSVAGSGDRRADGPRRGKLQGSEFERLARVVRERREKYHFLLRVWVFLPDPAAAGHAIIFPRYPLTISRVMESIKVGSTHRINSGRREWGLVWQPRFFDRAVRTVQEYHEKVEYIHLNAVGAGLVERAEDWPWSSLHDYTGSVQRPVATPSGLCIDRIMLPADERARM